MTARIAARFRALALCTLLVLSGCATLQPDPLPSWNEGSTKQAIVAFVRNTTDAGSAQYVPPERRVATFDQDGTLWVEHPIYTQVIFALDRVPDIVRARPALANEEPFKTVLSGDRAALAKLAEADIYRIVAAAQAGMSIEGYQEVVKRWLATAKHPRFQRPYTELVYAPMLEAMKFLRANGYRTYIVTGGEQEFVRAFADEVYGVPPDQVVGTMFRINYEKRDGKPALLHAPEVFFVDDKAGKPVGINMMIGRRPQIAFGNSDGDQQMLEWTRGGDGARLALIVLHDDAQREYAYGPAAGLPDSKVGTFTQALYDEAKAGGWLVISMKNDWKRMFAFEK
jgi:phosphoglycolate phosphatase-like HAD superfamily hydrolase